MLRSVVLAFLATAARALAPPPRARARFSRVRLGASELLLVDHVNLNHETGRHDLLVAFYGDLLGLAADPRKAENLEKGAKTLWYNAGIHQLHLPEGSPRAQPLDGRLTLAYASLDRFDEARLARAEDAMRGSRFAIRAAPDGFDVLDPWGTAFGVVASDFSDGRGAQPGDPSAPAGIADITLAVSDGADLAGVRRFYVEVLGVDPDDATLVENQLLSIAVGPQTLTFVAKPFGKARHAEVVESDGETRNLGIHLSLYVSDLGAAFDRARALGLDFVNYRFKRRATTKAEALDQCMFRILDVVDPRHPENGPIVQVEHEVRSCVTADGAKYRSCPFDAVPDACSS